MNKVEENDLRSLKYFEGEEICGGMVSPGLALRWRVSSVENGVSLKIDIFRTCQKVDQILR